MGQLDGRVYIGYSGSGGGSQLGLKLALLQYGLEARAGSKGGGYSVEIEMLMWRSSWNRNTSAGQNRIANEVWQW